MRKSQKSRNRRSVRTLAVLALGSTVALSGCGSSGSASNNATSNSSGGTSAANPVTINVYVGKFTADPQAQTQLYQNLISQFEQQNPGIKVKWSSWASASEENTSIQTSLATKQGPDIFELGSTLVPTASSTNGFHVLSAQDWTTLGGRSKFFPAQLTMSGPSATQDIGVPEYMLPFDLVYNKKMFQQAGIQSPPTTWTQFIQDAQKMSNPAQNQWGTVMDPSDPFDPWHIGWVMTKQLGGDFLSADAKTATLDSSASVSALQFWFDWITKYHIVSPNALTYKSADVLHAFENGKVGMLVMQGPTFIPSLNSSPMKGNYAFAPMPTVPYGMSSLPSGGTPVQTFVSGQYLAIPNYVTGSALQATLKWLKFVTEVPQQQAFFKAYGYMPANLNAYSNYAPLETPTMKAFVSAENNAYPTPFSGAWGNLEVVYGGVASKIANEIATNTFKPGDIATALKAANAQVQSSLQQ